MPSPVFARDIALFLDVDGTLLELAEHPDAVAPHKSLPTVLQRLEKVLGGALALISGRTIDDLDRIFAPLRLPEAGQHGLERRDATGMLHRVDATDALDDLRAPLRDLVSNHSGLLLEDKGSALALHYRQAPALENTVRRHVAALTADHDELHYLAGKMVFEIKSRSVDKGVAIGCFMTEAPFADRLPVFLGDDVTDEDGFRFVNAREGCSIRVDGPHSSTARFALADVTAVLDWLDALATGLEKDKR